MASPTDPTDPTDPADKADKADKDEDVLTGAIPDAEVEPSPSERIHARRFAALIDKALVGRPPPALPADDRALLEVATVIRAAHGGAELSASRQRAVVEDALRQALGEPAARPASAAPVVPARRGSRAPWWIAGATTLIAIAALAMLWLVPRRTLAPAPRAALPVEWRSRSADGTIGPIARDRAGDASARIDAIFADRLDGFRAGRLLRGGTP